MICLKKWRATLSKSKELIVISGATGWLGLSLLEEIAKTQFCSIEQIVLISSQIKEVETSNRIIKTNTWKNLAINSPVGIYFDFAFQTQEKIIGLGEEKYIEANEKLIENSVNFIKSYKPKAIFLASSGAVYGKNYSSNPNPSSIYGKLKLKQEAKISKIAVDENLNLLISRVFNLSGRHINKFQTFAIAQMIKSAMDDNYIKVLSDYKVFRRYTDVNQFTRLILNLLISKKVGIFDSGGPLIEIRELALEIKKIINPLTELEFKNITKNIPVDDYYSRSDQYEDLLRQYLNEAPISIKDQILETFRYMQNATN